MTDIVHERGDYALKGVAGLKDESIYFRCCQGLRKAVPSADEFLSTDGLGPIQE